MCPPSPHVYVHVPFCKRRCSYCDFAIAVRKDIPGDRFVRAIETEFELRQTNHAVQRLETLYLGGGTPSLLSRNQLDQLIGLFRAELRFATAEPEVTIEANPDDVSPTAVDDWLALGINRVSLGVQSLNPAVLQWMHRPHRAEDGPSAVRVLKDAGMPSVSVDVIFGLPRSLGSDPVGDVRRLLEHGPDHVSAYGLTVEPRTPLSRWINRGAVEAPDESGYADEFLQLHDLLDREGFEHYEISNYALAGRRSRHNQAYWKRKAYLGLGPSAHSFVAGVRRWNIRDWAKYDRAVLAEQDPRAGEERLSEDQDRLERLYLGLRTSEGADLTEQLGAHPPSSLHSMVEQGWLTLAGHTARATLEGWLRLDSLVAALTTSVEGG